MAPPKKSLGQHFLHDPGILGRIADLLEIEPGETVLEIGPGPGGLTAVLAGRAARLIVIEKDRDLAAALATRLPAVTVVEGDALELDWHRLSGPGPTRIIGNIPYNITSPLLEKALLPPRPACIVFLVQKEVADRVAAPPGGAEYGALSVGIQEVARVEKRFTVAAGAFRPPPRVESAVLRLWPLSQPLIPDHRVAAFRRFTVGLFGFRRKQLGRGLRELTGAGADQVGTWLEKSGIEATRRPQELSPDRFVGLFQTVADG
jgi:16S rRNA (adenine1518-N6/adenine1519-N6)-dimethyltransferase